ncbi:MAG: HlyD family efflux transporter periplasmic adaptor subunit, partial [Oscillospiraceae bacterium]
AYTTVTTANKAYTSAQTTYNEALNAYYNSMSPDNSALMKKRDEAKRVMTKAQERYDTVKAQKTAYEAAKDAVVTCQDTLEQAITSQKLQGLDMQKLRQDIGDKQTLVNKLSGSSGAGGEIKSEIFGVIKSIGVTAGNSTTADTVMAAIEVPDRGYITTISVTSEQAKRVTVGDSAEVTSGYWGGPAIEATLSNIKPDPQNPQANKLLIFSLKGEDIQSGSQVSVSIGQKSQNYDVIVPSSAVREDSNGSFVLVVMAKSSPLGNRYVATRVDVQVLAKDDTNSAVSGGVAAWDYVVTNSTKPIESGMQVRMTDAG